MKVLQGVAKRATRWLGGLAVVAGCLVPWSVQADHVCTGHPDEVRFGTLPGGQGVAPVPLCRWMRQPGGAGQGAAPARSAPPPLPTFEWRAVTFNAVATSRDLGVHGMSSGHTSQLSADNEALRRCGAAGGKLCQLLAGGQNGCLALARGPAPALQFEARSGPTGGDWRETLERVLLEDCQKGPNGQACQLVQTVCEADRSLGPSTRRQPGAIYNGQMTPPSPVVPSPHVHHCGAGRLPVLVRMNNRPNSNVMYCLPSTSARNDPHPNASDAGFADRRFEWFENRFAASAFDDEGDAYGLAVNAKTQAEAEAEAMARCRAAGGKRCTPWLQIDNVCIALARGPGKFRYAQWGFSEESTAREAVEECTKRAGGGSCTFMAVGCSYGAYTGLRQGFQPGVTYRYTPPPQ